LTNFGFIICSNAFLTELSILIFLVIIGTFMSLSFSKISPSNSLSNDILLILFCLLFPFFSASRMFEHFLNPIQMLFRCFQTSIFTHLFSHIFSSHVSSEVSILHFLIFFSNFSLPIICFFCSIQSLLFSHSISIHQISNACFLFYFLLSFVRVPSSFFLDFLFLKFYHPIPFFLIF